MIKPIKCKDGQTYTIDNASPGQYLITKKGSGDPRQLYIHEDALLAFAAEIVRQAKSAQLKRASSLEILGMK